MEARRVYENLTVLSYPDPRLRKICQPVTTFDADLRALAERMFVLMREHRGVGLAASQVGVLKRLFVANATSDPQHDRVYVNPVIEERDGSAEAVEGCLSLPDIEASVTRSLRCRIRAQDVDGAPFELSGEELIARVWQHEIDHLDGMLILDRMKPADKIATRKALRDLEADFDARRRL